MKNIIKQLVSEALVSEFYGKKIIEPITKRFNDSSDDIINKLGIAFLFKVFFGDIMQYKTKQDFESVFDNWYQTTVNGLIKTASFIDNKPLAKKYLDAYINNIVSLGDKAQPFSFKNVEKALVDLVNNNRWIKDEDVVAGATIYNPEQGDILYEDDDLIILDTNTKAKCVRYGAGESWCITKPELNYYNTYRLSYGATPYFVLQKNVNGNEHKLVILNYGNGRYSIADRSNSGDRSGGEGFSMSWNGIEREIPNLTGHEEYFKYREISDDERRYADLLEKIKDEFNGNDLQELIDNSIKGLVVNGAQVSSADFIRDLAANRMYFSAKQLESLNKESLDSLIEGGYFVSKYFDSYLYDNVLTPTQINRIIKLKLDNNVILDGGFYKFIPKERLKEYLLKRLYANNYNDAEYSSDSSKAKLKYDEIIAIKKLLPNQTINVDRFDPKEEVGIFNILLSDFNQIKKPEIQKNLNLLDGYHLKMLVKEDVRFLPYFMKLDNFSKMSAWDYEELIKDNPKQYKLILNSLTNPEVKDAVIRYLRDSGLYPYFVRDGFIDIKDNDDFEKYSYDLIHKDKSKAFLFKPELLQYEDNPYNLEIILINQPSLFKYLDGMGKSLDKYRIIDIISGNPKSLEYIPKEIVDNLSDNSISNIIYKKPSLARVFANRLNAYDMRTLINEKPVVLKYTPISVFNNFDRWELYNIVRGNKKAIEYLEPYLDEYRPDDKDFIMSSFA